MRWLWQHRLLRTLAIVLGLFNGAVAAATAFHPGSVATDINRESPYARLVTPFEKYPLEPRRLLRADPRRAGRGATR